MLRRRRDSRKDPVLGNAQEQNMALQFSHGRPRERLYHTISLSSRLCYTPDFPSTSSRRPSTLFSRRDSLLPSKRDAGEACWEEAGGGVENDWVALMGASRHSARSKVQESIVARTLKNHFYISGVSRKLYRRSLKDTAARATFFQADEIITVII